MTTVRRHISVLGLQRSARSSGVLLTVGMVAVAVIAAGCSSTKSTTPPPARTIPAATATAVVAAPIASSSANSTAASSPAAAAASGLSGTWSGRYGGAYQGTFRLVWQETGSTLSGQITLSAPAATLPIDGTVTGGAIRFGTVGSLGITYAGSVSGKTMSGSYQVAGSAGGSWSASKS